MLKFPPLVVASSALLCAWSHLGNLEAIETHMPQLGALCGVAKVSIPPRQPAHPCTRPASQPSPSRKRALRELGE